MMLRALTALPLLLLLPQAPGARPAPATIDDVAWIAGAWSSEGSSTTQERWLEPAGGAMLGTSRTIAGGRMVAFEFLRIVERDGSLVYVAQPGGNPPTAFVLTALDGQVATFENPEHDYPKLIRYTRTGDALVAEISDANGARPMRFSFRRMQGGQAPQP